MNDERLEELAALRALDLLEGDESREIESAIAADRALGRLAGSLQETAAALAYLASPADPPPELKRRIMASVGKPKPSAAPARILPFSVLIPWAIAAALAVAALGAGRLYMEAHSEAVILGDQRKLADLELKKAQNELEAERIVSRGEIAALGGQLADTARWTRRVSLPLPYGQAMVRAVGFRQLLASRSRSSRTCYVPQLAAAALAELNALGGMDVITPTEVFSPRQSWRATCSC